jgi:hypothetical protein
MPAPMMCLQRFSTRSPPDLGTAAPCAADAVASVGTRHRVALTARERAADLAVARARELVRAGWASADASEAVAEAELMRAWRASSLRAAEYGAHGAREQQSKRALSI